MYQIPSPTNGITPRLRRKDMASVPDTTDPTVPPHLSGDGLRNLVAADPTMRERRESIAPLPDASLEESQQVERFAGTFAANSPDDTEDEPREHFYTAEELAFQEPVSDPTTPPHMGALPAPSGVPTTPGDPVVPDDGTDPRPLSRREAAERERADLRG